ncbi:hypothetical protein M3Y99_00113200 [Aphelenchoides fujianensis]|nr:hypothetical protein M3Y99_00113200 [Aphelenchoides fujianensis]
MNLLQLRSVVFLVLGVAALDYPINWDEGSTTELPTSAEENTWEGRFDSRPARGPSQSLSCSCKQLFAFVKHSDESEEETKLQQAIETVCRLPQEPSMKEVCKKIVECECLFEPSGGRDQ